MNTYLKLDGSFIQNLPQHPEDRIFIRAMTDISKAFGMTTIAEWIEDEATLLILRELGVDMGQGHYFGRPAGVTARPT